jgi:hypothetical protein
VSTLHITNGDSAAGTLREFLADRVAITADVLYEGPAPAADPDEWLDARAAFHAASNRERAATRRGLAEADAAIAEAATCGDAVLWFEHDLFDQLQLIRTLSLIGRTPNRGNVSLICVGAFPGVDRFIGLGQLTAAQLQTLLPTRSPVTQAQYDCAARAWTAFTSPTPQLLVGRGDLSPLPFLDEALARFLEEYPSRANGLSRTANAALQLLAEQGSTPAGRLFLATQQLEPRPFMGDLSFYDMLRALATARVPLVALEDGHARAADRAVRVTAAGRDVVSGRADAVKLNGIDEWRGGVHLLGEHESPWRWDAAERTLVS